MKVKTNSWHFRLIRKMDKRPSENLCMYFWQVCYGILMFAVAIAITIPLAAAVIFVFLAMIVAPLEYLFGFPDFLDAYPEQLYGFAAVGYFILALITMAAAADRIKNKTPSILARYVSAKRSRLCPIIEFENDQQEKQASTT